MIGMRVEIRLIKGSYIFENDLMKNLRMACLFIIMFCFSSVHSLEASIEACRYFNVDDVYSAAEIVVVGKVVGKADNGYDFRFAVTQFIKGKANSEIILEGNRPVITEPVGFGLTENVEVLLFLHKVRDGVYGAVETYNGDCQTLLYYVVDEKVVLQEESQGIPLDKIQDYLGQAVR